MAPELTALLRDHGFGMRADGVDVSAAHPSWPDGVAALIRRLPAEVMWHHVGSTSVPGLDAKPVADLLGEVAGTLGDLQPPLVALGFLWLGEFGVVGRRFLRLRAENHDYAHLHLFQLGDPGVAEMLRFRERLRADPLAREEYAALKRDSAVRFATDRDRYTENKAPFIQGHLK